MRLAVLLLIVLCGCATDLQPDEYSIWASLANRDTRFRSNSSGSFDQSRNYDDDSDSDSYGAGSFSNNVSLDEDDVLTLGMSLTWYLKPDPPFQRSQPAPLVLPPWPTNDEFNEKITTILSKLVDDRKEISIDSRPGEGSDTNQGESSDPNNPDVLDRVLMADWRVQLLIGVLICFFFFTIFLCRKQIGSWIAAAIGRWRAPKEK